MHRRIKTHSVNNKQYTNYTLRTFQASAEIEMHQNTQTVRNENCSGGGSVFLSMTPPMSEGKSFPTSHVPQMMPYSIVNRHALSAPYFHNTAKYEQWHRQRCELFEFRLDLTYSKDSK